jgi:hypothetical protein
MFPRQHNFRHRMDHIVWVRLCMLSDINVGFTFVFGCLFIVTIQVILICSSFQFYISHDFWDLVAKLSGYMHSSVHTTFYNDI